MSEEIVTYRDVARWLPTDIRERIEATVSCMGGGEHEWHYRAFDVTSLSSGFPRTIEYWSCARPGCNLTVKTDPTGAPQP